MSQDIQYQQAMDACNRMLAVRNSAIDEYFKTHRELCELKKAVKAYYIEHGVERSPEGDDMLRKAGIIG